MPNKILLKGNPETKEYTCTNAAITPGMLLALSATGVRPHNTADGTGPRLFAAENGMVGDGITDTYAVGDNVIALSCSGGEEVYAFIKAGEAAVSIGQALSSNGAGYLQVPDASPVTDGIIMAYAAEAVDNSGGGSAARIKVVVA